MMDVRRDLGVISGMKTHDAEVFRGSMNRLGVAAIVSQSNEKSFWVKLRLAQYGFIGLRCHKLEKLG